MENEPLSDSVRTEFGLRSVPTCFLASRYQRRVETRALEDTSACVLSGPERFQEPARWGGPRCLSPRSAAWGRDRRRRSGLALLLLGERTQRAQVPRGRVCRGFRLDGGVVADDEVDFESRGRAPVAERLRNVVAMGAQLVQQDRSRTPGRIRGPRLTARPCNAVTTPTSKK